MAKTITREDMVYASFPILKWTETDDGDLIIYGKATDGTVDSDKQIVDPQWSGPALERWLRTKGNVRVQHSPHLYPAGKGVSVEIDRDGDGGHWVKSRIVEDTAKKLVKAGVLQDYSVGIGHPLVIRDVTGKAKGGVITGNDDTEIVELSIVDRGSNHNSGFTLAKSANHEAPWTYGDIAELLARADVVEKAKRDDPDDTPDPDDDEDPGDGAGDDSPDADYTDEDDSDDDASKAYMAAVAVHKAAEPRRSMAAANGTDFLRTVADWKRWDIEGDENGLDGTPDGYGRWLAKRDFDPNVGGGVDRDKIPAKDFVDPTGRRFPIDEPGDVSDAVHAYGQAKPLIPMRTFRRRLTAIARRKGDAYVAQLPASWTAKAATKDITLTDPDPTGLAPYNLAGAKKPKKRKRDMAVPDTVKGAKNCPKCGAAFDADSKLRRCDRCGAKLPKGDMVAKAKKDRMVPADVKPAGKHREPDGSAVEALEHDAGMHTDPDPTQDKIPSSVKAGRKPRKAKKPADGKPFPGAAPEFGAKNVTPYQVQRMHAATCAAYHWDTVSAEYPALKSVADAIAPVFFADQVQDALTKGDMASVAAMAALTADADAIAKGYLDPAVMADGRAMLHKSFGDMYPDTHLTPGAPPRPGQFQRPYITAGHAPLHAGTGARRSAVPPSTHVPDPDQFDRPLITAGHEAESPSDKGNNLATDTVASGAARTYYRNASKEAARGAMQAMHDHIAATFPDMCPMAPSRAVMPENMRDTNVPKSVVPLTVPKAPGEKAAVAAAKRWAKRAEKAAADAALADADRATSIDEIVEQVVTQKMAAHDKAVTKAHKKISKLQAENDRLGALPDPAQAPLRGVVVKAATIDGPVAVEKESLIEKARAEKERDQADTIEYLRRQTRASQPGLAEAAERALAQALAAS